MKKTPDAGIPLLQTESEVRAAERLCTSKAMPKLERKLTLFHRKIDHTLM